MILYTILGSPPQPISKNPGDTFGATITGSYQGPAMTAYVGITLSLGHGNIVAVAYVQKAFPACSTPTAFSQAVSGVIPTNAPAGQGYDCQVFVSSQIPQVGAANADAGCYSGAKGVWFDNCYTIATAGFQNLNATFT